MIALTLASAQATEALGAQLATVISEGCIIYLQGELGTGKTTLVRGLLRTLGYEGVVRSPTYTLVEPYSLQDKQILHLDLYRLVDPEELEFIGLRDWLDGQTILLVEWPEHGGGVLPVADLQVELQHSGDGRLCQLRANSAKGEMVLAGFNAQLSRET
jgi:tRNA threonylcarbamoyladenosine biosynthesis protein TsaE